MNRKISEKGIRIGKIEEEDQKRHTSFVSQFFLSLNWIRDLLMD